MTSPALRLRLASATERVSVAQVVLLVVQFGFVLALASLDPSSAALVATLFILQMALGTFTRHPTTVLGIGVVIMAALLAHALRASAVGRVDTAPIAGIVLLDGRPQAGMRIDAGPGRTATTDHEGRFAFDLEKGQAVTVIAVSFESGLPVRFPFRPPLRHPAHLELRLEAPGAPTVVRIPTN